MRYLAIVMIMVMTSIDCDAQNKLEYFFTDEVTKSIEKYIDSYHEQNGSNDFFLILYHRTDNVFELNVSIKGEVDKEKKERLLNLTNRYVMIDENKLPLILEEDFKFGVYGRDDVGIKRWFLISEGFSITIDGRGRIID